MTRGHSVLLCLVALLRSDSLLRTLEVSVLPVVRLFRVPPSSDRVRIEGLRRPVCAWTQGPLRAHLNWILPCSQCGWRTQRVGSDGTLVIALTHRSVQLHLRFHLHWRVGPKPGLK